jgi:hypothetical protein
VFDQGQGMAVVVQPSPTHLLLTQLANDPRRRSAPGPEQSAVDRLSRMLRGIDFEAWIGRPFAHGFEPSELYAPLPVGPR